MIYDSGVFDTKIIIEKSTNSSGDFNETIPVWKTFKKIWCEYRPTTYSERFNSDKEITAEEGKLRSYYIDGIEPTMRIKFHGKTWDIIGIAMIGRREQIEITVRRVN